MTAIWPDSKRRDHFFQELADLIERYPELTNIMRREYAENPTSSTWTAPDGQEYDPNCPVIVQGVVLIISTANLDGWEDLTYTDPRPQSIFLTQGMLTSAADGYLRS